jgi:iron complex outermembrane receptor protein
MSNTLAPKASHIVLRLPCIIALVFPLPLLAQTSTTGALEEVVVTAQKREQSAQDVPIALSALSGDDLAGRGITSAKDIATAVPNLLWSGSESANVPNIYIRGVGDSSFHTNQVGSVGMYSDEISLNSPLLWNFGLFDLERVEVLRGPQNTLFGRNTTGGAMQFESRTPKIGQDWSGYASLNGGNYGRFDGEGALAIPVSDHVAARVSIARFAQGNYLDNLNLNRMEGGWQRSAARVQLLWQPSDTFAALLNGHAGYMRGGSTRYKQIGLSDPKNPGFSNCPYLAYNTNPGNGCSDQTGFIDSGNFTQVWSNSVNLMQINSGGGLLRLDWKLDAFTLTSLTGFEHEDSKRAEDSAGGPSFIFNFEQSTDTNQLSQELRLASTVSGPLKWLAGLYWFNENLENTTAVRRGNPILSNATTPGLTVPEAGVQSFMPFTMLGQTDNVWSAYGRVEYEVTKPFSITAGLRFTSEHKSGLLMPGAVPDLVPLFPAGEFIGASQLDQLLVGATQVGPGPLPPQCPHPFPLNPCYERIPFGATWNILGGNLSFNYRFADDVLGYASVARGFKGGGVSEAALDAIVGKGGSVVIPEFLWTYELGIKSEWLQHRLRVNAAAFYNNWTNEQLFLVIPTPLGDNPVLTNVPKTRSDGIEFDITAIPASGWSFTVAGGYTHSEATDVGGIPGAVNGSQLLGSPKFNGNLIGRRQWELGDQSFGVQGTARYTGATHWDLANTPLAIEPGYWLFDASADYRFGSNKRYQLSVWGKNLTATQYCWQRGSLAGLGFGDVEGCYPNEATRFFGVSVRANFQ